jgi:hypothetical protein
MNGAIAFGAEAIAAVAVLRGRMRIGGGRSGGVAEPEWAAAGARARVPSID